MLHTDLQRSVFGEAWHGPSLLEAIRDITPHQSTLRPIPSAHTIGEIILHAAAWMEEVLSRANGQRHAEPEAGDWAPCTDFPAAVARLQSVAQALIDRTAQLTPQDLDRRIGNTYNAAEATGFTLAETIRGVTQHNTYHAGQIILLTRMLPAL
ncbi:MAG: DinB family protein [Bryobacterales bacterium]|nr:DinB family protein [Bryobacterales bacterium]